MDITFVNPTKTASLSATGTRCSLNCAHCGGHYLRHMLPPQLWGRLDPGYTRSCLVSGGCDVTGKVPVLAYKHELQALARDFRLNFHVGLMDEDEAREISPLASVVSFDFVAEDETIREVYGVRRTAGDYLATYEMLRKHVRVIPHICVGLRGGRISGEYAAIDALREVGAEAIVFLVLIPTPGTRYAGATPPPAERVIEVMEYAREVMPGVPVYLGCMRPRGEYRARLDQDAVELGVDRIVAPAREAVVLARERGLNITWHEECCAFA